MNVGYRPGTPRPAGSHGSGTQESDQNVTWERPHPALWLRARRAHSRASRTTSSQVPPSPISWAPTPSIGCGATWPAAWASSSAPSTIACSRTARSRWLSRRPCARSRRANRARSGNGSGLPASVSPHEPPAAVHPGSLGAVALVLPAGVCSDVALRPDPVATATIARGRSGSVRSKRSRPEPGGKCLRMVPALELAQLVKRFGLITAVDRIDLAVPPGELVALLGPSGCGKTTTLRIVAGFERPDFGRVRIQGVDVTATPPYGATPHGLSALRPLSPHDRPREHRLRPQNAGCRPDRG